MTENKKSLRRRRRMIFGMCTNGSGFKRGRRRIFQNVHKGFRV